MPIIGALEENNKQIGLTRWSFTTADVWEEITVPVWAITAMVRVYDSADPSVSTTNYVLYVDFDDTTGAVGANDSWFPMSTNINPVTDFAMRRSISGGGDVCQLRMAVSNTAAEVAIVWEGASR